MPRRGVAERLRRTLADRGRTPATDEFDSDDSDVEWKRATMEELRQETTDGIKIRAVPHSDTPTAPFFVYTFGATTSGHPEVIVRGLHRTLVPNVGSTLNFLFDNHKKGQALEVHHNVQSRGFFYKAIRPDDEATVREELMTATTRLFGSDYELLELVVLGQVDDDENVRTLDRQPEKLKVCANCNATAPPGGKLRACAGCNAVRYCSRECQKEAWKYHKKHCAFHAARAAEAASEDDEAIRIGLERTAIEEPRGRSDAPPKTSDPAVRRILLAFSLKKPAYIRFIDGDVGNCASRNLEYVTLRDALFHAAEWKVDWDAELSDEDAALVRANGPWFAGLVGA